MNAPFFIGWANHLPRGMRGVLAGFALLLLVGAGGLGTVLSALVDDPGGGDFLFAEQKQSPCDILYGFSTPAANRSPLVRGGGARTARLRFSCAGSGTTPPARPRKESNARSPSRPRGIRR